MMDKVYQPLVIEKAEEILESLVAINFFRDYELENVEFARQLLKEKLTDKFINGELEPDTDIEVFTEDEFDLLLKEIITGSLLYELKDKGWVNSYEDEDTEETFFLTEEGKRQMKEKYND